MVRSYTFRLIGSAFLIVALGTGCGGSGCSFLKPLPTDPKPLGFPTDQVIEGGVQARITKPGMDKLTASIPRLIKSALGSGFCAIPPTSQDFGTTCFDVTVGACEGNGCAGNTPGCPANLQFTSADGLDKVTISVADGNNPIIHVDLAFDVEVPLEIDYGGELFCIGGNGSCQMDLYSNHYYSKAGSSPLDIALDIQAGTDPTTGELTLTLQNIAINNLDLAADGDSSWPANKNNGCGDFLGSILSDVLSAFNSSLGKTLINFVANLLKPQINALIQSFLPKPLGLAGTVDSGALLASFNPPTDTNLEMFIVPGGYVQGKAGGLTLGVLSGMNSDRDQTTRTPGLTSEPSLCVPNRPTPDLSQAPWMLPFNPARKDFLLSPAGQFAGNPDPVDMMGATEDVAIGLSRTFLDLIGFHIYNSGTLCLSIGGDAIPQLNAGTLSVIINSLGNILEDRKAPLALVLRPQTPLNFTIGAGTDMDPLIHIAIEDMRIDFYAWIEERFVRLMTVAIDLNAGLNLTVTKNAAGAPALQPTLVGLDPSNITIRVSNTDLLTEKPDDLAKVFPSLLNIATGALGGVIPSLALPAVAGFSLDNLQIQKVQTTQDDFIGIFGTIMDGSPMGLIDFGNPFKPRSAENIDTVANVASLSVPAAEQIKALFMPQQDALHPVVAARPQVTLDLSAAGANGRPVEYAWKIDNGMWRGWTTNPHPVLADDLFLLQGHHTIDVRSRLAGDWLSEDSTPAHLTVLIDSMAPELHPQKSDDGTALVFGGFDIVSDNSVLLYSWQGVDGQRSPWTSVDRLPIEDLRLITDDGAKRFNLFVKDEAGNIGQSAIDLGPMLGFHGRTTNPPTSSGCGCTVGAANDGAGTRGPIVLVLALMALVFLRRRQGTKSALAIAFLGLGFYSAGCSNSSSVQCVIDDDCQVKVHTKCDPGQLPQCQTGMCACTPDVDPGEDGRFSSMTMVGGTAYVSAYNATYGDLMIGHVTPPGIVSNWDFVDGVPNEAPEINGSHVRGGIQDKGEDDGRYTSILATASEDPIVAYYDKTHGALKFASFGVIRWHSHVIDQGMTAPAATDGDDVGRWASMTLSKKGIPAIAYTAIVHQNTKSGMPESQLRWAEAKTATPMSTGDWTITVLDSRILGVGGPSPTPNPTPAASPSPAPAVDVLLPEAIAIMASASRKSDDSPAVAYYDRTRGNLRYIEWLPMAGAWSLPVILDGEQPNGNDTGDVGQYPSLAFDNSDVGHISYVDATHDDLDYLDLVNKTRTIVDDGYRPADEMTLDGIASPVYHLVGDSSSIQVIGGKVVIAYQDSTVLQLRVAVLNAQNGMWSLATIAGHANPFMGSFGFYADLQPTIGGGAMVASYGINQQLDTPLFFVEVFGVDLGGVF
jgi:MYXO-CTERM domain-containing protein